MNGEAVHTYTLKLAHCNVNGICNKLQIIRGSLVNSFHPGILAITESHLMPSIAYATVAIPGYELLRNGSGSSPRHGVCTYIRKGLRFDEVDMSHANCLSFRLTTQFARTDVRQRFFSVRKLCVYVYVVYRPSNSPDENQALIDFIFNSCADKEVIILGDFNLPSILILTWSNLQPCGNLHWQLTSSS